MKETFVMASPVGRLLVETDDDQLVKLEYHCKKKLTSHKLNAFASQVKKQIENYFKSPESNFTVPVSLEGTAFQKKVWAALQKIPAGQTRTYGEVAMVMGIPGGARAIGQAMNKNPLPIIFP